MAGYKVSYKVLKQQGDELKAVAKLVDGYAERVSQINGKLGDDAMLSEIRKNLTKLREQLGESRVVLNTAGEFLSKTVDSYSGAEVRQVKNVDGTRAHNRDFYKNPSAVPSAGGGSTTTTNTVNNYTDNSVNTTTYAAPVSSTAPSASAPIDTAAPITAQTLENTVAASDIPAPIETPAATMTPAAVETPTAVETPIPVTPPPVSAEPSPVVPSTAQDGGMSLGAKAAIGTAGAGAVAAGALGGLELKKRRDAKKSAEQHEDEPGDEYDPEVELAKAIARVRELEEEE